jgi:hypothetical protein
MAECVLSGLEFRMHPFSGPDHVAVAWHGHLLAEYEGSVGKPRLFAHGEAVITEGCLPVDAEVLVEALVYYHSQVTLDR